MTQFGRIIITPCIFLIGIVFFLIWQKEKKVVCIPTPAPINSRSTSEEVVSSTCGLGGSTASHGGEVIRV